MTKMDSTKINPLLRCTRCVMDNSADQSIMFDQDGICNYCRQALAEKDERYFPNAAGQQMLQAVLAEIKRNGKGKKYDCVMGLSGGLDSSYLAYLGHCWGLRILAFHIDDGFDTDVSKQNLLNLVRTTGFDYEIIAPDVEQFNALTKAFMLAGVPNLAIPQDNILFAFIYKKMKEHGIKYFLSGHNWALESILQRGNTHDPYDVVNIRDIQRRFGSKPIDKLLFISTLQKRIDQQLMHIQTPMLLNYIDYNRERAFKELGDFCGFEYYGSKHLENILTAFIQLYWLPKKFGVDKRTSHLSSLIVSGQMSREQALDELSKPLYDQSMMERYIQIVKEKIGISDQEFAQIMSAPARQHTEFKTLNRTWYRRALATIRRRKP